MKHIWKYMTVALAALSLAACENKEYPVEEFSIEFPLNETKAILADGNHIAWEAGDQIGWFADQTDGTTSGSSTVNMNTDPHSFTVTGKTGNKNSSTWTNPTFYFFAPYKSGGSRTSAPLSIPATQNGASLLNAMPMAGLPVQVLGTTSGRNKNVSATAAQFLNLGAIAIYNVYTSNAAYSGELVEEVMFTSNDNIAGNFNVNLTTVSESNIPAPSGLSEATIESTIPNTVVGGSKETGVKVYQVLSPGSHSGSLLVITDAATYEYTLPATSFARATKKIINLNLGSISAIRTERSFTPAEYEHTFVSGDWGIGADPSGHPDGDYYMDWGLVNPSTLDGISWSWTLNDNNNPSFDAGGMFMFEWALQIGDYVSGTRDYILSSTGFPGRITEVYIDGWVDEPFELSCTVGGDSFGSPANASPDGNGYWYADFSGSASGELSIIFHSTAVQPVFLNYIYVAYEN